MSKWDAMESLFSLLEELESKKIYFVLERNRRDAITISIRVPGERLEIDVLVNGELEVSRFRGDEDVVGSKELVRELIDRYAD